MNRWIAMILMLFLTIQICNVGYADVYKAVFAVPSYAKWGQMAMREVGKRYKGSIIDYLHVGRKTINSEISEETFTLWLRDGDREYGVIVRIRFDTVSESVISISFQETDDN